MIKNRRVKYFIIISILPNKGWFSYFMNEIFRHVSFHSWSMKFMLHQEGYVPLWNMQFWCTIKNRRVKYFTIISILSNKGWFSYFTNQRIRYASFDSWSAKVILKRLVIDLFNLLMLILVLITCFQNFSKLESDQSYLLRMLL